MTDQAHVKTTKTRSSWLATVKCAMPGKTHQAMHSHKENAIAAALGAAQFCEHCAAGVKAASAIAQDAMSATAAQASTGFEPEA